MDRSFPRTALLYWLILLIMPIVAVSCEVSAEESIVANLAVGKDGLQTLFVILDKNGDGLITQQEMMETHEKAGLHIGKVELLAAIKMVDANGDGNVNFKEFVTFYEVVSKLEVGASNLEEDLALMGAFAVFDGNGDDFITAEELLSVMCSLGSQDGRTAVDCQNKIRQVDLDGDGMVNYAEFKEMAQSASAKTTITWVAVRFFYFYPRFLVLVFNCAT